VAQKLQSLWGQNVVVDNRAGGTGTIGLQTLAAARADGYTISLCTASHAARQVIERNPPYDLLRGFSLVTQVTAQPYVLVLNPSVPATSVAELVAHSNEIPKGLTYGSSGQGSMQHLAGVLFASLGKANLLHVPYKGGGPALVDLLAGQISLVFATMLESQPHIKTGRLRALAVTGTRRLQAMPSLPTVAEAGVLGYEMTQWYGVLAPPGTPQAVLAKLNQDFTSVLRSQDLVDRFARDGVGLVGSSTAEFRAHVVAEIQRFQRVISSAGLKLD